MFRPEIDCDDDLRDRVKEYAEAERIRMPRAYAEILRRGLDHYEDTKENEAEA